MIASSTLDFFSTHQPEEFFKHRSQIMCHTLRPKAKVFVSDLQGPHNLALGGFLTAALAGFISPILSHVMLVSLLFVDRATGCSQWFCTDQFLF